MIGAPSSAQNENRTVNSIIRLAPDPPPRRPPAVATELPNMENSDCPTGGARFTVFSRLRAAAEKVNV